VNPAYIVVPYRTYGKIARFDHYQTEGPSLVIRLANHVQLHSPQTVSRPQAGESFDPSRCREFPWRGFFPFWAATSVVVFQDGHGHDIRVVTDWVTIPAQQIADMYRSRWQVDLFFHWIKPH